MSVSKCGYDNSYGETYRIYHNEDDLKALNQYARLLTVCGGVYIGELYCLLVISPACAEQTAIEYYSEIYDLFYSADDSKDVVRQYKKYRNEICDISRIMKSNYTIYTEKIWPVSEPVITEYAKAIEMKFNDHNFSEQAEKLVGEKFKFDAFYATMCNSLAYGAEAIDISDNQDVFGIDRSFEDAFYFIGHEFIIYLLKQALVQTSAFKSFETWGITEGLAEFYMIQIMGNSRFFKEQLKYANYYKQIYAIHPEYTAKDLYLIALKDFNEDY
jgi:hypothetical protein